jgi:hypothetical protein
MLDSLKTFFGIKMSAASALPVIAPPKVKPGSQGFPAYIKTATPTTAPLAQTDSRLATTDITTLRDTGTTQDILNKLSYAAPDLSAAVFSYLRTGIPEDYTVTARNLDGTFNPEATLLCQQLITRFDILNDYSDGFSGISSMRSNSESLGREIILYGAASAELVLGKDRLPRRIQPISTTGLKFKQDLKDPKILSPVQVVAGQYIDLDWPTFFYVALDQDLLSPYSRSPMESALQPVFFSQDFMNDIRRVVKRAIHPRTVVAIDEEQFRKNAPAEAMHDEEAMTTYQANIISQVKTAIDNLRPEDALVLMDTVTVTFGNNGNISLSSEYDTLNGMADAKMATGAKTLPAILGHGVGSSNIASTETMMFMKNADGAVRQKLNELYSRIFTLAARLFGQDVYVEFRYADIDLRPKAEMEAFAQTKQTRILELLSLGLITDEEACLKLTGALPPAGMKPLSGTMFKSTPIGVQPAGGSMPGDNGATNDGSTHNQNLNSKVSPIARGKNTNKQGA